MSDKQFGSFEGCSGPKGKDGGKFYEIDAALWTVLWDLQNAVRRLILLNKLHGKNAVGSEEQWERLKKFLDEVLTHSRVRKKTVRKSASKPGMPRRNDFYCDEEEDKFDKMGRITDEEMQAIDWEEFDKKDE